MWKWFGIILLCIGAVYTYYYISNNAVEAETISSRIHSVRSLKKRKQPNNDSTIKEKGIHNKATVEQKKQNVTKKPVDSLKFAPDTANLWPVKKPPLLPNALLPSHRIVAFYGNLYSKRMGILGEYSPDTVLSRLEKKVKKWQAADSSKIVIPALQLIVVTGQGTPGRDSLYRQRMPFWMVDSVIRMAHRIDALVILDFQVGQSTVEKEIPHYEKYLKLPQVSLAIDPEFSMKKGYVPGSRIGTLDASDINFCIQYLKDIIKKYHLPPKVLVVHRFTQGMVTHYKNIQLSSEVQVIMDMDGFGAQALKENTYHRYIYLEPVEYTGIKLFFQNDNQGNATMMTPTEVLKLHPQPLYIQYQ